MIKNSLKDEGKNDMIIKKIIMYLIEEENGTSSKISYSERDLLYEIIRLLGCDVRQANGILCRMKELGLDLCCEHRNLISGLQVDYDLLRFAQLRGHVPCE